MRRGGEKLLINVIIISACLFTENDVIVTPTGFNDAVSRQFCACANESISASAACAV